MTQRKYAKRHSSRTEFSLLSTKQFADINNVCWQQYLYFDCTTIQQIVSQSSIMLLVRLILFFFNKNSILYCEQASNGSNNETLSPVAHGNNSIISGTLILDSRKEFWNIYEYSRCPSIRFYRCMNTCSRRKLRHWHNSGHTLKDRLNEQLNKARQHTWIHRKSDVKQVNVSVKCNQ